jgi:hypothetical protein
MRRIDYGIVSGRRLDGKDLMPGSRWRLPDGASDLMVKI